MGYIVLLDDSHSSWLIPEVTAIFQVPSGRYLLSIFYFHTWNIPFNFALLFLLCFPKMDTPPFYFVAPVDLSKIIQPATMLSEGKGLFFVSQTDKMNFILSKKVS